MRASGILMPIFSLPSKYGIGTLGKEAYNFVDFLKKSGQSYWQILPLGVTGFGNSPYQCYSSYAGNPYLIDLELLCEEELLKREEIECFSWGNDSGRVDYDLMIKNRLKVLNLAFSRFDVKSNADYQKFVKENGYWLEDYALYSAIKESQGGVSFNAWEKDLKHREKSAIEKAKSELCGLIDFHKVLQYFFSKQWFSLKSYANKNGIRVVGDIPIYVAYDSADVWSEPEQFLLDESLACTAVAGTPPDAFSDDGQLWGNPLYNWKYMKTENYAWWIKRIGYSAKLYDVVRIDHFRAFSAYFSIPAGDKTAKGGKWVKGPGKSFFECVNKALGSLNIIAEDLGTIDDAVRRLLKFTGYPGMKVLQFAFDPSDESTYLPHNITDRNCVVYTGTHDNDTAVGFMKDGDAASVKFMREYLNISEGDSFNWSLIKAAMATTANTVILQMQDLLGLDNSARTNTPSTTKNNWEWRIGEGCTNDWLAKILYDITATYFRLPPKTLKKVGKNA